MQGLAAEAERLIAEHQRGPLLDVVLVASAQAIEHHEIAAYGTMRTLARSSGMGAVADLLEQTLQEEKATDEKLTRWPRRERSTRRLCNKRPEAAWARGRPGPS